MINMMPSKLIAFTCLTVFIGYGFADIAGGANTYLPPKTGYNYNKPTKTFPTPRPPITPPYQPPGPSKPSYPSPGGPSKPSYPSPSGPTRPSYPSPGPSRPSYPSPVGPSRPQPGPTQPSHDHHQHHEDHHHHEPGMPFDFQYSVNDVDTANDYSHKATSDGDVTRGEYRVQLPDGRTQIVRYTADWRNGFNAEVTYEGQAVYPEGPSPFGGSGGGGGSSSNQGGGGGYRY